MSDGQFHPHRTGQRKALSPSFIVFTVIGMLAGLVYLVEIKIEPAIAAGARAVALRAGTAALNQAVTEELASDAGISHIMQMDVDKQGELKVADFDFAEVVHLQSEATKAAEDDFARLSNETLRMPVGQALGGALLGGLGPSIPVHVYMIGSAHSSITVEAKTVGINQTVHSLYLELSADVQVVAPLVTQPAVIHAKIPLAYVVFNGRVPNSYFGTQGGGIPVLPPRQ